MLQSAIQSRLPDNIFIICIVTRDCTYTYVCMSVNFETHSSVARLNESSYINSLSQNYRWGHFVVLVSVKSKKRRIKIIAYICKHYSFCPYVCLWILGLHVSSKCSSKYRSSKSTSSKLNLTKVYRQKVQYFLTYLLLLK